MAKPHQRVMALVLAFLFLLTSVGAGAAVIWQIRQDNDAVSETSNSDDQDQASRTTEQNKEGTLEGTKLENFEPVDNVSELQKIDIKQGDGEEVKEGATVTAHYTGALANNGTIFQSSKDFGEPVEFPLSNVIKGWTEGVPGMKVGGTRRLLIPYSQAYGDQGSPPSIPSKADLVFDIEITAVKNP